jgi:hypothetical protein
MVTYRTYSPYFVVKHIKFDKLLIILLKELKQNEAKLP